MGVLEIRLWRQQAWTCSAVNRQILLAVSAAVTIAVFLSLRACFQSIFPREKPQVPKIDNSIVALGDGSVMVAKPGTISRNVIDWFNDKAARPKQFDIGPQPFIPNSDRPAPESEVRLGRFVTELRGNPDVNVRIIVCGPGGSSADRQLAAARALHLKEVLVAKQIDASRISAETCNASIRGNAPQASKQEGQTVGIALSRGD